MPTKDYAEIVEGEMKRRMEEFIEGNEEFGFKHEQILG